MFGRVLGVVLALVALGATTNAQAQRARERWVLIATHDVDLSKGSASIDINKAPGAFKAVRVEAKRQGLDVTGVRVVYGDGKIHDETRLIHLLDGERSKPIDQRAEDRFIDRLELTYKTGSTAGRAPRVEIWALQSPQGRTARRQGEGPDADRVTVEKTPQPPDKPSAAKPGERTEGGDVMFGYQDVGFGIDRDTIRVGSQVGKFARLRLRVLNNDVFVNSLKVVYADGSAEELAVNREVRQGRRSDWMELKGTDFISEIQLLYRSRPRVSGQARVEVTGQYADGWLGADGEGRKYNEGWVLLGAQSAGMFGVNTAKAFGFDKDVIPVGANEGGFKRIRVKVRNRSITLKQLRVVYYDGDDTVIDKRTRVDPDQIEGPWDVKDNARIKQIVASYRGRLVWGKGSGVPVVEIWGQH